ncbi:TPA: hypothetical protein ACKOOW_000080 [Clostridioides difficile]|uniref:hypothetical protein n=1 Tax=Clostridioides difficile TaxID=1496 RepID=UPI0010BA1D88|nr:hypothetical protein [Clostridioides difficile]MCP8650469.1 hypothetical protein [Clostridioides difficile]MDM0192331.1 hypothetical protein [Clostridioides difficile]VIB52833.1 Uncharacterised protein [Clostridioides difficile]
MKVGNINGQAPITNGLDSCQSEVQGLEQKKKSLQDEIEKVRSDKSIDGETAKLKIEALKKEMEEIENKIQELKGKKTNKEENNVSEVNNNLLERKKEPSNNENVKQLYDVFERSNVDEQWDNTYRVLQDDKNLKVKFNRPI